MDISPKPFADVTTRELLKLGRRIERDARRRRELLKRVAELEGSIREARRLFRQLADQLGLDVEPARAAESPTADLP